MGVNMGINMGANMRATMDRCIKQTISAVARARGNKERCKSDQNASLQPEPYLTVSAGVRSLSRSTRASFSPCTPFLSS